ncbi:Uma2 family endonuclease [Streptomyces sp. NPDC001070]
MTARPGQDCSTAGEAAVLAAFLELVVPEGYRAELIEGEIVVASPPDPTGHFRGQPPWAGPAGVVMAVRVTTARPARDRGPRRRGYAAAGIPFYLLVDRTEGTVTLCSEPDAEDYRQDVRVLSGKELDLPEPFAFALDTSLFA